MSAHTPEPTDTHTDTTTVTVTDTAIAEPAPAEVDHAERSGWHPLNVGHLVMGLAFLGFVGIWAVMTADAVDIDNLRWLLPLPWVLAGAGGLLALALGRRNRSTQT